MYATGGINLVVSTGLLTGCNILRTTLPRLVSSIGLSTVVYVSRKAPVVSFNSVALTCKLTALLDRRAFRVKGIEPKSYAI